MLQGYLGSDLFGSDESRYYWLVRRGDPAHIFTPEVPVEAAGYDP